MNKSRSSYVFTSRIVALVVLATVPCVLSGRISEYLNQPRYLENPALAQAYNQVLTDLHDLEDMLTEGSVGGDQEPALTKKDVMDDWNTMRYPYRIKKNYNLDHLARMNFKRADSSMSDKRIHPSKFNQRHILGGLRSHFPFHEIIKAIINNGRRRTYILDHLSSYGEREYLRNKNLMPFF